MHPARLHVKLGAKSGGAFIALQARADFDTGSFPTEMGGFMGVLLANNYRIANIDVEAREVLTFKPGVGAYRAPTAPQAAFAIESAIDEVATLLDLLEHITQAVLLPVAYFIGEDFKPAQRKPIIDYTHWNSWGNR